MKVSVTSSLLAWAMLAACWIVSTRAQAASPLPPPPEWQQVYFSHEDTNTALAHDVSSETGNTRYYFDVPGEDVPSLHVSLTNAGGLAGTTFKMQHAGKVVCEGVQHGDAKKCGLVQPAHGRYWIEVTTAPGHAELLAVSMVREIRQVDVPVLQPFQFAVRTAFYTEDAPHCLESRHAKAVQSQPIAEAPCMPMGNPQLWQFEAISHTEYRIRNMASFVCLSTENEGTAIGTRVVEAACNSRDSQAWVVYGSGGFRQYALLFNVHAGQCLEFADGEARIGECNRVGGSHAAWAIRDEEERVKATAPTGGSLQVVRGGLCMSDDGRWVALGDCANGATSRYYFGASHFAGGGVPGDGQFMIGSVDNPPSQECMTVTDWGDGYRYASMTTCNGADARQRWTLAADANDWQVRNVGTGECLNAQHGTAHAGTRLITWPCAPGSDNARWRYLQL